MQQWKVHAEQVIHDGPPWIKVSMADVELPDGKRIQHNVVRIAPVAATVVINDQDQVLMLYRHRFITDTWNWEIPAGFVDHEEKPEEAAAREVEEETGYRPSSLSELAYIEPIAGITNAVHHVFLARASEKVGEPTDTIEADKIDWIPLADIMDMISKRGIVAGVTLVGLLHLLADRCMHGHHSHAVPTAASVDTASTPVAASAGG